MDKSPNSELQEISYPHLGIKIMAGLNRPRDEMQENIRINCQRGLPEVWPHAAQETVLALVGGGPSLEDTLDELMEVQKQGGKIVALAGAARYLLDHGITPNAHVLLDSRIGNVDFVTDTECTYFVASQCDPAVFDALKGRKTYIFHAINDPNDNDVIKDYVEKWVPIQGGNTIGLRALRLFQVLGYYRFELFGYDCCNLNGKHHAYRQVSGDDMKTASIQVNGRKFEMSAYQIQQFMEFMRMTKIFGQDWEIASHGDGLISHAIRSTQNGSDRI